MDEIEKPDLSFVVCCAYPETVHTRWQTYHEQEMKKKDAEIERLSEREGKATVRVSFEKDGYPFYSEILSNFTLELNVVDFGVADNCYVVECTEISRLQQENERLKSYCNKGLDAMKETLSSIGGCDHSVGICCCGLMSDIEEISKFLSGKVKP